MKQFIVGLLVVFFSYTFCLAFPTKEELYAFAPETAKEIKQVLTDIQSQQGPRVKKQVKSTYFQVDFVTLQDSVEISSEGYELNLWNETILTPYFYFSNISSDVAALDIVVSVMSNNQSVDLFSFHVEPRSLYDTIYTPVVVNQDYQTSKKWDIMTDTFELDAYGNPYPASKAELINAANNPFVYNGVQVQRDMLDGQGLRTHNLYALKSDRYYFTVKATLNNNQEEWAFLDSLYIENNLPTVSVQDYMESKVKIYYYSGDIVIENQIAQKADIKVFDMTGRQVDFAKLNGKGQVSFDMSSKAKGVYIVNIKGNNFNISRKVAIM